MNEHMKSENDSENEHGNDCTPAALSIRRSLVGDFESAALSSPQHNRFASSPSSSTTTATNTSITDRFTAGTVKKWLNTLQGKSASSSDPESQSPRSHADQVSIAKVAHPRQFNLFAILFTLIDASLNLVGYYFIDKGTFYAKY